MNHYNCKMCQHLKRRPKDGKYVCGAQVISGYDRVLNKISILDPSLLIKLRPLGKTQCGGLKLLPQYIIDWEKRLEAL